MLTLQIQNNILANKLAYLLQEEFQGNSEAMLQAFIEAYTPQYNRLQYSGILQWKTDGLTYQKDIRNEWG